MAGLLPQPRVTAQRYFFSAVFIFTLVNIDCDSGSWAKNCPKFFDLNATQEYILVDPIPMVLPWSLSHPHGDTVDFVPIPVVLPSLLSPLPRYYRGYRGFTAVPIPMQLSSLIFRTHYGLSRCYSYV